ncbi:MULTISPECIES: glycosyltransferase [Rhodomicrobium]|uniref:glycosyltransferase family 2 protein n=1 Tax=Rhodomicrobium TaxID=1068 RepID=UPI001482565D|nr:MULTISPECIES: glycosyltransferase [Rhodomicrobium]
MPEISVIVPSYNHAPYVLDAVASVLNQTHPVAEIIVVEDASSDDSLTRLRGLDDPRIKIIALDRNAGGSESLNIGIRAARCPLIAICNSDDLWEPAKLERQLPWLISDPNIGAVFTNVSWIGKYSEELGDKGGGHGDVFRVENRSRHAWMRRLLEGGNCFCHPSVLIRKSLYDSAGLYDNRLRQLPDYKMWLAIVRRAEIHVLDEKLVRFRIHDNTSAPSPAASTRDRNEFFDIFSEFMQSMSASDFFLAFGSRLPPSDPRYDLAVEKALYLWSMTGAISPIASWVANDMCMRLLDTDAGRAAWASYGFTMVDFHLLRGIESPWLRGRTEGDFTAGECSVLARIGAIARLGPQAPLVQSRRAPLQFQHKVKREILRLGRQLRGLYAMMRPGEAKPDPSG